MRFCYVNSVKFYDVASVRTKRTDKFNNSLLGFNELSYVKIPDG